MDELEREDMRRDVEIDAQYRKYKVTVTVELEYTTSAKSSDEAEDEAYEAINDVLRGSHLDYDFNEFESEEID